MKTIFHIMVACIFTGSSFYIHAQTKDTFVRIEMHLSAFGVESDNFPSIDAFIDLAHDTSICTKSLYDPRFKGNTYSLTKKEIQSILNLLDKTDLQKLQPDYEVNKTDQPTSTMIIYTTAGKYTIRDYGLEGEYPLKELYKIVYKY